MLKCCMPHHCRIHYDHRSCTEQNDVFNYLLYLKLQPHRFNAARRQEVSGSIQISIVSISNMHQYWTGLILCFYRLSLVCSSKSFMFNKLFSWKRTEDKPKCFRGGHNYTPDVQKRFKITVVYSSLKPVQNLKIDANSSHKSVNTPLSYLSCLYRLKVLLSAILALYLIGIGSIPRFAVCAAVPRTVTKTDSVRIVVFL